MASNWVHSFVHFLTEDYFMSDEFFGTFIPIAVYWLYSGMYMMLLGPLDRYRLHPKHEADLKDSVSKTQVVKGVLLQQIVQTAVAILIFALVGGGGATKAAATSSSSSSDVLLVVSQFIVAMVVIDTYQYFTHWYLHHNKFLYRRIHSIHHRVVVTHAFGALYGHPLWDGIIDTIGTGLAFIISGMSSRTGIFFFSFIVIKVIDDHCGLWLPGNPFHIFFSNNSAFHDYHHQLAGGKYNFSQPFFVTWDKIMGTYMPVSVEKRTSGGDGFVVKTAKDY